MRRAWICFAVIGLLASGRPVSAEDAGSSPVFTNKVRFRIPFRSDPAEMQRLEAREVQLFVSTDHGTRWKMVDKAEPRADHFDFIAANDAEYWFAVRTLDAFNRLHPQGNNIEPGLKVVVDATPPVLELLLTELEPGKVELRWTAADDHLDTTKLRLEYRQPDSPEWQQVGVVPQANGQTTWTIPAGGVVAVRGTISDSAGNTATAERDLNVHPAAHSPQNKSGTEYRAPVATAPLRPAATQAANEAPHDLFSDPPAEPRKTAKTEPATEPVAKSDQEFFTDDAGPRIHPRGGKDEFVSDTRSSRPPITPRPDSSAQTAAPMPPSAAGSPSSNSPSNGAASLAPSQSPFSPPPLSQSLSSQTAPSQPTAGSTIPPTDGFGKDQFATPPATGGQAKDDAPRTIMVNSRDFKIGYHVDDVGPSGVGKVELFITQDGGQKWYRYGTDPDNQTPFPVTVSDDGVYGFELRVKNGAGIGDDPPRPGDKPSIIVTVDKTPPTAQLLPPQIGRGASRNKVLLRWTASDANLIAAPILLEYAAEQAGPWQKIGDWQANSGRYIWSLGQGLPGKVYLRVTAKDEAGNVTQTAAPDALLIDFVRPTARIVDVEAKSDQSPRN